MIRNYTQNDEAALLDLWNTAGTAMGFAPLSQDTFRTLLTGHPNFSPEYTFVLEERGKILGFTNGCTGDGIPKGDVRGYVSCVILAPAADTPENTGLLLTALEDAFRKAGRQYSAVTFFNPIRLPWIIPAPRAISTTTPRALPWTCPCTTGCSPWAIKKAPGNAPCT